MTGVQGLKQSFTLLTCMALPKASACARASAASAVAAAASSCAACRAACVREHGVQYERLVALMYRHIMESLISSNDPSPHPPCRLPPQRASLLAQQRTACCHRPAACCWSALLTGLQQPHPAVAVVVRLLWVPLWCFERVEGTQTATTTTPATSAAASDGVLVLVVRWCTVGCRCSCSDACLPSPIIKHSAYSTTPTSLLLSCYCSSPGAAKLCRRMS